MKANCELHPDINKNARILNQWNRNATQIIANVDFIECPECPAQKVSHSISGSQDGMSSTIKSDNVRRVRNSVYPPFIN